MVEAQTRYSSHALDSEKAEIISLVRGTGYRAHPRAPPALTGGARWGMSTDKDNTHAALNIAYSTTLQVVSPVQFISSLQSSQPRAHHVYRRRRKAHHRVIRKARLVSTSRAIPHRSRCPPLANQMHHVGDALVPSGDALQQAQW